MSAVHLHPHFVAACSYADVSSVVKLLKEPIDDADFKASDDAPYLPAAFTSTIHLSDTLSGLTHPMRPSPLEQRSANRTVTEKAVHAPFESDALMPSNPSRLPSGEAYAVPKDEGATPFSPSPLSNVQMRNDSCSKRSRLPSLAGAKPQQPKVLYIWDVDDTLVASGVSGVRQNPVFRDAELVALFRSAGDNARHLFLSQGSIDDVLDKPCGRLSCVRPFLERTTGLYGGRRAGDDSVGGSSAAPGRGVTVGRSRAACVLCCGASSQIKAPRPSALSAAGDRDASNGNRAARSGFKDDDLRHLGSGTVVVRLTTVRGRRETAEDAAFLDDPSASPTCSHSFEGVLDERAERPGRWLILRPEVWGITLASMSTFFPPSRNTAFVNGKLYRKMDVVWSLAMSSAWDSVLFIDNNLSELGVVRYGLQMSDLHDLRRQRNTYRFFQADYLLLATSAKLHELELQYGRDVTKPPETTELSPSVEDMPHRSSGDAQAQKATAVTLPSGSASTTVGKTSNAEETGDLTPSKSTTASSCGGPDSAGVHQGGVGSIDVGYTSSERRCSSLWDAAANGVASDVNSVNASGSDSALPHPDAAPPLVAQSWHGSSSSHPSVNVDGLSPRLPCISHHPPHREGDGSLETAAIPPLNATKRPPKHSCRDVDLVVVNLHLPSEAYQQVLTAARTDSSGQRSMQRTDSVLDRYVGQPVFVGDRSCTDEQYRAILKYFQEAESALFQLIDEDMRANGFVDVSKASRWVPDTRTVYAPIRVRPTFVPHLLNFYKPFFDELEEQVVLALQHTGSTRASRLLHKEAQRLYYTLQRALPFIDPYLTGDLGCILFDICITDGSVPRSLLEQLKKTIAKTRACIQPGQGKRQS
ncbi:hypothetical protein LSCM1_01861 [Leishmania martiniquensis]|uniref:Uncharacterized protein n=1 Tax=Leishmania martiniquensis TaxID=1580590 RepID=A0A836KH79_9TRYP|nr:hypothetical protein LSCM1_01861 [Leishmania martiniquensis]